MGKGKAKRVEQREETRNYPNFCEICVRKFPSPSGFTGHLKIHDGEDCVVCPRCFVLTSNVTLLVQHGAEKCLKVHAVKAKKATKKEMKIRKMEKPGGYVV